MLSSLPDSRIRRQPQQAASQNLLGMRSTASPLALLSLSLRIYILTFRNLTFIAKSVDATNAPNDLIDDNGKKVFRLFNLAFHHFEDPLGKAILKNTMETADGFGYSLQYRRMNNLLTVI
jgi:hypothetical protein